MAKTKVTVTRSRKGFEVRWVSGFVTVRSKGHADALRANVRAGMSPAKALYEALVPSRPKLRGKTVRVPNPAKWASQGGQARAASMTAEKRSAIAKTAAAARWGKTMATASAVEEVK